MERGLWDRLLSWMLLPVSAVLVVSALGLSRQPYTGVTLRGDWVASVVPGSPGALAGIAPRDRLLTPALNTPPGQSPLARATRDAPLIVLRERAGRLDEIRLTPGALPDGERRMMGMLLAVACGFVVLGGWVWSERRDALTRTFFLLCLAFAVTLAPLPRFASARAAALYDSLYAATTLFLPALFVHFFALFPGAARLTGRAASAVAVAYGVSGALFAAQLAIPFLLVARAGSADAALAFVSAIAGLWFAAGCLGALLLFARAYARAHTRDARRRLRVALAGAALGAGPLAAVVAIRNLDPSLAIPGERFSVALTLLVPISFAWAAAVHQIFEFRVALRAGVIVALLGALGGAVYIAGEWLAAAWRPDLGAGLAGGALAFVAIAASVAGPANAWVRGLGARLLPAGDASLAEWLAPQPLVRHGRPAEILTEACGAVARALRLDGCTALAPVDPRARDAEAPAGVRELSAALAEALAASSGPLSAEDPTLPREAREELARLGAGWVLPVGAPVRAAIALGRRLSGSWLGLRESRDLERFSAHLALLLENAALREAATVHDERDRALTRAGTIQAHLLPRRMPNYPALDCAAATLSSEPVGGDYYDFLDAPDQVLTLAIGDAAGKGVPAALMGVWAQASFRSLARRGARPGRMLDVLNRELVALDQPQAFVALLCARFEVRHGVLEFANAGLTPPLVRRRDGAYRELSGSGVLLGVVPGAMYANTRVKLARGDLVLLYSDGLTEARRGDELFGVERLEAALDGLATQPAAAIVNGLIAAVQAFADHPLDDVTLVVLKQLEEPARRPGAGAEGGLKSGALAADTRR